MQRLVSILLVFMVSGCGHLIYTAPEDGVAGDEIGVRKVEIRVPAAEGDRGYATALEKELMSVSGVEDAKVCHYRGVAFVELDPKMVDLSAVQKLSEALDVASDLQRRSAQSSVQGIAWHTT